MSAFRHSKPTVDWEKIDRELEAISSDYRMPRFDSLAHVVEILGGIDPKDAIEELKGQKERLERLIDSVVDVYHNGFNLAIQNYSQILQLFSGSREQVDSLKTALNDSRRRLGAQPRTLRQQWRRSVLLKEATRLLDDVQMVTEVPSKVDASLVRRDWPKAVTCLLDGCGKAGREEMARIRALTKIKEDLVARWRMLQGQITAEVQKRVYNAWVADPATPATPQYTPHARTPHARHQYKEYMPPIGEGESDGLRRLGSTSLATQGSLGGMSSEGSSPPSTPLAMKELVDCMAHMGCMQSLKESVDKDLETEIGQAALKALQSLQAEASSPRSAAVSGALSTQQSSAGLSIPYEVTINAAKILKTVLGKCHSMLHSMVKLFEILAGAVPPVHSVGVEFLRSQQRKQESAIPVRLGAAASGAEQESGDAEGIGTLTGAEYMDAACLRAWDCIQDECLLLVAHILNAPLRNLSLKSAAESQDAGWLARLEKEKSGRFRGKGDGQDGNEKRASKMTFSFGLQVDGVSTAEVASAKGSGETLKYPQLVPQVLGHSGGTYLTPVVYKAILTFSNAAIKVIQDALERFQPGLASKSQALQSAHNRLRQFIEDFVMETFLPQLWIDFRARCTAALEDPEAFHPQARTRASVQLEGTEGVLPVASVTAQMVQEVCSWAATMPHFASSLTGVLENILGRVQDAFTANIQVALGDAACGRLATCQEVATLMAHEDAAGLLPDSTAFTVMGLSEGSDTMTSPHSSSMSGLESDIAESEIFHAVLSMRPFGPDGLVCRQGNFHRMVELAAMSDSLEYVATKMNGMLRRLDASSPTSSSPVDSGRTWGKPKSKQANLVMAEGLSIGLATLSDRYRSLAGLCIRALRLDMICLCAHHLSELTQISHLCEENERRDMPVSLGHMIRHAARAEEDIAPHISPSKRKYVFGVLPSASTKLMMRLLPEFEDINLAGVERMTRIISILQPSITSLLSPNNVLTPGATKPFDSTRAYFSLLNLLSKDLVAFAQGRPKRYLPCEWRALLEVHVPGRFVAEEDIALVERATERNVPPGARLSKKVLSSLARTSKH